MKKLFAFLTALCLLFLGPAVLADSGTADVVMEGETYHLTLDSVSIVDGKLNVVIEGFGSTLRWGENGPMVAGLPEAHYGSEIVHVSTVNMNVGADFTFGFERDSLPDEIWMISYDKDADPVLIWRNDESAGSEAGQNVPAWQARDWQLETIHFKTLSKDSPFTIDGGLSLNGSGSTLRFENGSVSGDVDVAGLILAIQQLPFAVPELDFTQYESFAENEGVLSLEPGGAVFALEYDAEEDGLSLKYTTHVEILSQDMGNGMKSASGESDMEIILGFVPAVPDEEEADAVDGDAVPDELVGEWKGTGVPKNGGHAIDLAARIGADGSGEYTFVQDDYTESYPFTISSDGNTFSVDIPADNYLGISSCSGTWAIEDGILKLDITTAFASGGSYSYTAECEKVSPEALPDETGETLPDIAVGDIVTFGRYEQDNDMEDGPEPIEWIAVDTADGYVLLVSRYALDVQAYHHTIQYVTWQECTLRSWLNHEFCQSAFSDAERADILESRLENPDNPHFKTYGGSETEDLVFLLSIDEAVRYFPAEADRAASRTAYASALADSKGCWWLRSPGSFRSYAACVNEDGLLRYGGEIGPSSGIAVRPALWLRAQSAEAGRTAAQETQEAASYAQDGSKALVRVNDSDVLLEMQLFTASYDNWELMKTSIDFEKPNDGEFYMVRFALPEESEAMSYDDILMKVIPWLQLRALSDGEIADVYEFAVPDWDGSRVFDAFFYFSYHELSDLELLCEGVPYTLEGLPRDGEPLRKPTEAELAAEQLSALHVRAKNESGRPIDEAACSGNVIVVCYTSSDDEAKPSQVLTAGSEDDFEFPREYRAESFETARWAAVIHPAYRQVGWYTGLAAGAANETTTWLSLFDLETGALYELKAAVEDPPRTITVTTINGIPQRSGASGTFRPEEAVARLAELVQSGSADSAP